MRRRTGFRGRAGFTIIEVMVSIGVMTIGAMAVFAMQQQAMRANVHARELTIATQIAQTWIERLKIDALLWRNVGNSTTDLAGTAFLGINTGNGTAGAFTTIPIPGAVTVPTGLYNGVDDRGVSNGFDYYGNDTSVAVADMPNVHFCASYRLSWVFRDAVTTPLTPTDDRALRVDVRVWWAKEISVTAKANANRLSQDFVGCADDGIALNPGGAQFNNYHIVYLSTVLRATP